MADVSLCIVGYQCVRSDVFRNKKYEFYIAGTDAVYDKRKIDEMLRYESKGSKIVRLMTCYVNGNKIF